MHLFVTCSNTESTDTASLIEERATAPQPGLGPAPQNRWECFHRSWQVLVLTPKEWQVPAPALPFSVLAPAATLVGAVAMGRDVSMGHGDRV